MRTSIVSILSLVGILGVASAAEAVPVTTGSYFTSNFHQNGTFSGSGFSVTMSFGGGEFGPGGTGFNTGTQTLGTVGTFANGGSRTITIGGSSCSNPSDPTCRAVLTFNFAPNLLPGPALTTITADSTFTMTGLLTVGATTLNIEGSGTLHALRNDFTNNIDFNNVRYTFSSVVPEPSSVVLMLVGLLAVVGLSRRHVLGSGVVSPNHSTI